MTLAVLAVATVVGVFLFSCTKYRLYTTNIITGARKSARLVVNGAISDHWKERVLPQYSLIIFSNSLKLFVSLATLFVPFALFCLAFQSEEFDLAGDAASLPGVLISTFSACLCLLVISRAKVADKSGYNVWDRLLHRLVLSNNTVGEAFFDIELGRTSTSEADIRKAKHVFVAGLARSGTTILMRSLYESRQFSSLTYTDMPFVLAPNLWRSLRGTSRQGAMRERSLQDGIRVNFESPEALEEVFWRTFDGESYIKPDKMVRHPIASSLIEKYTAYIGAITKNYGKDRYLTKNNNNLLRLEPLLSNFENSIFLVPYRHPLQQANSLLRTHDLMTKEQGEDPFFRKYMTWLAHHEFGLDKKRMLLEGNVPEYDAPALLEFWLEEWVSVYGTIVTLASQNDRVVPIGYELLCDNTEALWPKIAKKTDTGFTGIPDMIKSHKDVDYKGDDEILSKAIETYHRLNELCARNLNGE